MLPALLISLAFGAVPGTEHALDAPAPVQAEPSAQRLPDVAGGLTQLLAVWEDDREGASGIWAQRFTATGITSPVLTPVGTNFRVSPPGGEHHVPRIAAIANTFYVVWESTLSTNSSEVLFARVTPTTVERAVSLGAGRIPVVACASQRCFVAWQLGLGTVVGAPIDANPSPDGGVLLDMARNLGPVGGTTREPAVVTGLDPESFAVVYVNAATAQKISATRIFSDAGIGQPFDISPGSLVQKNDPDIAAGENGYCVVWTEGAFGVGTPNVARLTPAWAATGAMVQFTQGGVTTQQPRIHRFGRNWVIAVENDSTLFDTHVVRVVLDDALDVVSSARLTQFPVNSTGLGAGQRAPALTSVAVGTTAANEVIVVEDAPNTFTSDILAVTASSPVDGGMLTLASARTPLAFSVNAQRELAVAPADGKFLASWADSRLGPGRSDLFTLRYQSANQPEGAAVAVAADGGTQRAPTSVSNVDGAFVAWLDYAQQGIFASRIRQGTPLDGAGVRLAQLYAPALRPGAVSGWNGTQAFFLWETQSGIAGRTVNSVSTLGQETLVTDGNQPSIAWDGAAWLVADRSLMTSQVRVTRVTAGGASPPLEVAPGTLDQLRPLVLSDSDTRTIVLWVELIGTPSTIGTLRAVVPAGVATPVLIATNVDAARPLAGAFDGTNFVVAFSRDGALSLATVDVKATRVGPITGGFAGERPSLAFSRTGKGLIGYDRFADAGTQRGFLRDLTSLPDRASCFSSLECSNGVCVMGQCGSGDAGFLPGDAGAPCDLPSECQTPLLCEQNFCCPTPCPFACMTCETGACVPRLPDVCNVPPRIVTQQLDAQCGVPLEVNLVSVPATGVWSFVPGDGPSGLTLDAMGHLSWVPPAGVASAELVTVSVMINAVVTTGRIEVVVTCGVDAGEPTDGGESSDGGDGPRFDTTACTGCSSGPGALALLAALLLYRRRHHSR